MRGKALPALRLTFHLDRNDLGGFDFGSSASGGGGARCSAAQSNAGEGARACVHPPARFRGRSGGLRRFVKRRNQLSQPQPIPRRLARGSRGAVYSGHRRHLCSDPHRVFAGDSYRRPAPARRRVHQAAHRQIGRGVPAAKVSLHGRSLVSIILFANILGDLDNRCPALEEREFP